MACPLCQMVFLLPFSFYFNKWIVFVLVKYFALSIVFVNVIAYATSD